VSFISLSKIIPVITHIARNTGHSAAGTGVHADMCADTNTNAPTDTKPKREIYCILLIKPQFEVGQVNLNKQGIVTSQEATVASIQKIKTLCTDEGYRVFDVIPSQIDEGDGNHEYLIGLSISC
jgi:predicted rRNA methylase YqxC with S4 and FtsJ domains